jgi:RND superfamily putative drug exporter
MQRSSVPAARTREPLVQLVAGWSARHRRTAVLGWLALVATAVLLGQLLGSRTVPSFDPGEAGRAQRALHEAGVDTPPSESVLVQARTRTPAGPELRQAVAEVTAALRALPGTVRDVRSPLDRDGAAQVSADGRSALVTFQLADDQADADGIVASTQRAVAAVQARHPDLRVEQAGEASVGRAIDDAVERDFRRAELSAVPVTLVILLLVFGALIAAGIPILLAGSAVTAAIALLAIPSRWLPIDPTASSLILLVGMAVGVDYTLFYLRREREECARGHGFAHALRVASATSGRAIVVSGLTVMISVAGLFLTGIDVFSGMAVGTIAVIGIAVLGSVTALPALLAWLGPRVDRGRLPLIGRRRTAAGRSRLWDALVRRVVRRPLLIGGVAALALLALAVPATRIRTGSAGLDELPAGVPVVDSLRRIEQAFPGGPDPARVVVTGDRLDRPEVAEAVAALRDRAAASGGALREPIVATPAASGRVLVVSVPLTGTGTDRASMRALDTLRGSALPATLGRVEGISYAVTGITAGNRDFAAALHARAPVVLAFVLALAFLLLLMAFRSVAIPLTAILLNLLSVGAAYGVVKLVFQDGHLEHLLGFRSYGAITPWLPLFMFVLLFGLSMDYHVFILSRIRELRMQGASTPDAIIGGISASAGVVTSAAAIMVAVFSIFAVLSLITFKMFGVGMAVAVLIDATVVRGVLLPAAMSLLGERNWSLPRWLRRLPGRRPEPAPAGPVLPPAPERAA